MTVTMQPLPTVSKQVLRELTLKRRIERASALPNSTQKDAVLESLHGGTIPNAIIPEGWAQKNIRDYTDKNRGIIGEFIGTGDLQARWFARQRYEVEAGRDEEPLLFPAIYNVVTDSSLPRSLEIFSMGPAGVVLEEIQEGGEVKFASINTRNKTVTIQHFGTGLEYSEDLMLYNEMWRVARLERQFGIANNALQNHAHMNPILSFNYTGNNATNGTTLTSFRVTDELPNKYLRTLETAIATAASDQTNPRRGPYVLICASADQFTLERALGRVPQQGFDASSSARDRVRTVVVYDGWSGTRGQKATTYGGVTAGTAYLVNLAYRDEDFQSFFKHQLRQQTDQGELTRFIMQRTVWDVRFGLFADPVRAVHKITLPTATSGQA